jgi:hypothetical protein
MTKWIALAAGLLAATPGMAQDLRFCPNRPSLGSSACTTEPGHVQVEASALDWQRDDTSDTREDQVISADLLARFGVGPQTEIQVGWTGFGHVRTRDKATGSIDTVNGVGDVRLALRQNIRHPDGKGLSFGVEPFVTLPVGHSSIGDTTWSAGAVIPVTYDLSDTVNLGFTGQVAAQADQERRGRHLDYFGILGLGIDVSDQVTLVSEVQLERDDDPSGATSLAFAAESIAWQPKKNIQLDLLAVAGLNRTSPDLRIALGGAVVF